MSESPSKPNSSLKRKHAARLAAVQCIYSRLVNPSAQAKLLIEWQLEQEGDDRWLPVTPDKKLLQAIVFGVEETQESLTQHLEQILTERWSSKRMPNVMRAILLSAAYEMIYTPKLRSGIIIDQYVGATDAFMDHSDVGFVNAALQDMITALRGAPSSEQSASGSS